MTEQTPETLDPPRGQRFAVAIPLAYFFFAPGLIEWFTSLGWSEPTIFSTMFYLATVVGAAWHLIYPRNLSIRLRPVAIVLFVVSALGFLPTASIDHNGLWASPAPLGVVIGLILADVWLTRRRNRM